MPKIQCIHLDHAQTTGDGRLRQGRVEDFAVAGMTGEKTDFGFAFMRVPGKSNPRIISAVGIQDAVRVVFDKNPGPDTFLVIKAERLVV